MRDCRISLRHHKVAVEKGSKYTVFYVENNVFGGMLHARSSIAEDEVWGSVVQDAIVLVSEDGSLRRCRLELGTKSYLPCFRESAQRYFAKQMRSRWS